MKCPVQRPPIASSTLSMAIVFTAFTAGIGSSQKENFLTVHLFTLVHVSLDFDNSKRHSKATKLTCNIRPASWMISSDALYFFTKALYKPHPSSSRKGQYYYHHQVIFLPGGVLREIIVYGNWYPHNQYRTVPTHSLLIESSNPFYNLRTPIPEISLRDLKMGLMNEG